MKKLSKLSIVLMVGLLILTGCSGKDDENNKQLYFVTANDQGPYWMPLIASAKKTAEASGYTLVVKSGVTGDPSRPQKLLEAIQEGINQNVAGIAFGALDPQMFDPKAKEATEQGIKVITFDSDIATPDYRLSYIGTDNYNAGFELGSRSAADLIAKGVTGGQLTTVTFSGSVQNALDRYDGLKAGFEEGAGEYAGNFSWLEWIINDSSTSVTKTRLEGQIVANANLVAVFTLGTESAIQGTMEAIKSQNVQGKLLHYGFDYSPTFEAGISEGLITAIVDQNCEEMGRTIVEKLIAAVEGETLAGNYPIDVNWVEAKDIVAYGKEKMNQ